MIVGAVTFYAYRHTLKDLVATCGGTLIVCVTVSSLLIVGDEVYLVLSVLFQASNLL